MAEWMYKFEKYTFNTAQNDLVEACCSIKGEIKNTGGGGSTPPPTTPLNFCRWELVEICQDQLQQWIPFVSGHPPHLDHDRDGILNEDDPDWDIFSQNNQITQNQYTNAIIEYWDEYYGDEYGDYSDFMNGIDIEGGSDLNIDFENFFDNFMDGINDLFDDIGNWIEDLFNGDVECPEWPAAPTADERNTVICEWVHVLICNNGDPNWWFEDIEEQYPCDGCEFGGTDVRNLPHKLWSESELYSIIFPDFDEFMYLLDQKGCDPYSPFLQSCIDDLIEEKINEVFQETEAAPDPITVDRKICNVMFQYVPEPGTAYFHTGLTNVDLKFTYPGNENFNLRIDNIYFKLGFPNSCATTLSEISANAFNDAMILTQNAINTLTFPPTAGYTGGQVTSLNIRLSFLVFVNRTVRNRLNNPDLGGCPSGNAFIQSFVTLLTDHSRDKEMNDDPNLIFTIGNQISQSCPQ
jgi:hypothetical protein